jgi:ParB family chromosome partitioning protein
MVKVQQRGLGRGLSALMGDAEPAHPQTSNSQPAKAATNTAREIVVNADAPTAPTGVQSVPLSKLVANQYQPREYFDEAQLEDLSASIKQHGVMQPIVVRPSKAFKGNFEIIAGERRFRASKRAGLSEVPVIIRELTDSEALELALIENIQRQDLNPIEEAQGYQRLMEEFSYTQEALGQTVGKSRSHVANLLRVLTLPEGVKKKLASGELSLGHAKAILTSKQPELLAEQIVEQGLTVRQTEMLAKEVNNTPDIARKPRAINTSAPQARPIQPRAQVEKDPDIIALEETLTENLGLRVNINDLGAQKGEVVIAYDTLAQLDSVLRRLGGGV